MHTDIESKQVQGGGRGSGQKPDRARRGESDDWDQGTLAAVTGAENPSGIASSETVLLPMPLSK
jgi:hypothetical protein